MSTPSKKVSLKLLIHADAERVLYAEASKDFIEFLFNLFRLPLGIVTTLLSKHGMVGCLGKLYGSIENLSDDYLNNPEHDKKILLEPSAPLVSGHLLPASVYQKVGTNSRASNLYMCGRRCNFYVTYSQNTMCPSCKYGMNSAVEIVGKTTGASSGGEGGFVKGVITYMVMDDLEVRPMSTISAVTEISKFNVKGMTSLQEKVVELGIEEGIKLLKASLQCNNALTRVFLKNMAA